MTASATACANIAFVKYWGKRDPGLNLPAAGSLSLTLAGLETHTMVRLGGEQDRLQLDGRPASAAALDKALRVVEPLRRRSGRRERVQISSTNSFPTAAGLASSAAGLAALTVAAARALGVELSPDELSVLARQGSGSACRSIFGGFVEWTAGQRDDGSDSHARQLFPPEHWDLRCLVAVVHDAPKELDSTRAMLRTAERSPYHSSFLEQVPRDLEHARQAIAARNLRALGQVAQRSCLRMHSAMMAMDPPLIYLTAASWQVIECARALQQAGLGLFFTVDAGPNVKLFCEPADLERVRQAVVDLPGVLSTIDAAPGPGARLVGR